MICLSSAGQVPEGTTVIAECFQTWPEKGISRIMLLGRRQ